MTVKTVLADIIQNLALQLAEEETQSRERAQNLEEKHRVEIVAAAQTNQSLTLRLAQLEANNFEQEKRIETRYKQKIETLEQDVRKWEADYDNEHEMHKDCGPFFDLQNERIQTMINEQHEMAVALDQKQAEVETLTETNRLLSAKLEQYEILEKRQARATRKRKHE